MSMYGPPGGPYPGQPQDPWQGGQPGDPYGQPADPYGSPYGQQPDPWGTPGSPPPYGQPPQPNYGDSFPPAYGQQPGYGQQQPPPYGQQPGYPQQDMWGQPIIAPPPPKKSGAGVLIAVIVVLAVLVCGGGATALYLVAKSNSNPSADPTSTATSTRTPTSGPTTKSPTPSPVDTSDAAKSARAGDCLENSGTETSPKFTKSSCSSGTFLVLKRFEGALSKKSDGTIDTSRCDSVPGYVYPTAYSYWFDHPVDSNDFLLCLKKN